VWWYTPAIPALRRLRREEDHEFEASLNYAARPYLNEKVFSAHYLQCLKAKASQPFSVDS
jgi:hypothetical protein